MGLNVFFVIFANEMVHMQFTAVVLMTLLTLKLVLLPASVATYPAINKSRWLMAGGTALLGIQFLLQIILGLRAMGIVQPVMLNLVMFIPCSYFFSVAVILLQRQGRITKIEKYLGWVTWSVIMLLITTACVIDGKPLLSESHEKYVAVVAASIVYGLMLLYYFRRHLTYMKVMRTILHNYYDWVMDGQLRWMQFTIIVLVSVGLTVPLIIYGAGSWLTFYSLFFFASIFYFVDSFCSYVMSSLPRKLQEAEENDQQEKRNELNTGQQHLDPDTMDRVERAVEKWVGIGGHLKAGMKMPNAAAEMAIPQYQLSSWLRYKKLKYSDWMTDLRINEAKRVLVEHSDWSNEAVALHCGFSERSYFQTIFKKKTGMTPAEYIQTTLKKTITE